MATWKPPSFPYPQPKQGYWLPITATIDWCEENYYATQYSAEIVNSLTNLLFPWLAINGMINCWRNGHDRIFFITFTGYLIVGSGSFAFHSTLKCVLSDAVLQNYVWRADIVQDPWQLVDELSMIYTTCLMTWATLEHDRPLPVKILVAVLVFALAAFITIWYHIHGDPKFHQDAYAILTAFVLIRSMYLMETRIRPYFRKRQQEHEKAKESLISAEEKAEEQRKDDRDRWILKQMWTLIVIGLAVFLGGFGLWQIDNIHCSKLRAWRHEYGLPWGILLELHGWWHLGTGLGAYFYLVWGIWLRHCLNGRADEFDLFWPSSFTSIPRIVRTRREQNGTLKKKN